MALNTETQEYKTQEVEVGDTYIKIAKEYGISLQYLASLNDLEVGDLDFIYIGSTLNVGIIDKATNTVVESEDETDKKLEKQFIAAAMQSNTVDNVTQAKLDAIKEEYRKTGSLDAVTNDLVYLAKEGYSMGDITDLLNEPDLDIDDKEVAKSLVLAKRDDLLDKLNKVTAYDDSDYSTKDTILGLPFRYNVYTDPRRRIYNSTFVADAPIVSIIPGRPLFRSSEDEEDEGLLDMIGDLFSGDAESSTSDILDKTAEYMGLDSSADDSDDEEILKWLKNSADTNFNTGDLRYYRFQEAYDDFEMYLDLNLSTIAAKMGIGDLTHARYKHFMERDGNDDSAFGISRMFRFYCTKSGTSSSESINNEFGDSQIAGFVNQASEAVQEFHYLTGKAFADFTGDLGNKLGEALGDIASSVSELFGGSGSKDDFSQLQGSISSAANGNKLIWPKIWKNSTFTRTYNLSFEFVSPYGSPEAIFRYVYLPFIVLMTMACPKQFGVNGYSNPFLVRLEMPGCFTSDLAVIQSMSWKKGGNDNLFTNDGLPLAMTVDISVQDLYPSMMMAQTWTQLRHNTGMHSFLDNMAGLSVERFTPWQNLTISLLVRASGALGNLERDTIGAFKSKIYSITTGNPLFGSTLNQ